MPINLDATLSFADPDIKRFLGDDTRREMTIEPMIPADFTHEVTDRRDSLNPQTGHEERHVETVGFLMDEKYRLVAAGAPTGTHHAIVAYSDDIGIGVEFCLLFRAGLAQSKIDHGRHLLTTYDPVQHGADLEQWVENNLNGELELDEFELEPAIKLEKLLPTPRVVDASQREALFKLMGIAGGENSQVTSSIDISGNDVRLQDWAQEQHVELLFVSKSIVLDDSEPPTDTSLARDVSDANDPTTATAAIDDILAAIIPVSCGPMRTVQLRLLTVGGWPEFKIDWKRVRIKVGCCKITISVPVVRIRFCELVFYVYFKIPQNIIATILKVAETCAIRSALASAIIGVIVSNIAAAIASFIPLFRRCMETELVECLHPGLLLLKQRGPWQ